MNCRFQVNMTLPDESNVEDYIHRVGRVGRAGKMGLAISLVAAEDSPEKVGHVGELFAASIPKELCL